MNVYAINPETGATFRYEPALPEAQGDVDAAAILGEFAPGYRLCTEEEWAAQHALVLGKSCRPGGSAGDAPASGQL